MGKKRSLTTRLIHHPGGSCEVTGGVNTPIYQVSTFAQDAPGKNRGYDYSRSGNPTREVLENYIADLEEAKYGFAFASGMAAISAAVMLLRSGDHLIATEGLYGGSYRVLTQLFVDYDIQVTFVDTGDEEQVKSASKPNTRAILVETPSNPLMRITDISSIASLGRELGAFVIVDNTFMTPLLQRPLQRGADVVVHSATKFLGGHSDLIAGLVATANPKLAQRLKHIQNAMGAVLSPIDSWLLMRGIKTLSVRLERAQKNAKEIAGWLDAKPEVTRVYYPGSQGFEGSEIQNTQAFGDGAILSFELDDRLNPIRFLSKLEIWTLAVSLGAVESIITQPAQMTHLPYSEQAKKKLGLTDQLIRLSVGIEAAEDLIEDLQQGFINAG